MGASEGHAVLHCGDGPHAGWFTFRQPVKILRTREISEVAALLRQAGDAACEGLKVVGFLAYEATPAFDRALVTHPPAGWLAWFGLYSEEQVIRGIIPPHAARDSAPISWSSDTDPGTFVRNVGSIRDRIAAGETYQVNYTHRLRAPPPADAWSFFLDRLLVQPVPHASFLDMGAVAICSWSPELFFQQHGTTVTCRPMKGTAAPASDPAQLRQSPKDQAENIMIVDMIRNDLGHVATPGTIIAEPLFAIESYATVRQMTSTVTGNTSSRWFEVIPALFPCASITGAPKVRTMDLIRKLETSPRGVYTGTIGFALGSRDASFNVAIRTAMVDRARGVMEYGVGAGIVWDSDPGQEWAECRRKTTVLEAPSRSFELLETLRWTPDEGYIHQEAHLLRLLASADFWGFRADVPALRETMNRAAETWTRIPLRVRLLAGRLGNVRVEGTPLASAPERIHAVWDDRPLRTENPLLYHKTTDRSVYEEARARHPGEEDVLLWNAGGYACEFTVGNLVARIDGHLITPPVHHGLLPGVLRALELAAGTIREAPISREALMRAEAVYRISSLRGWVPVELR